ncbi:histidine kinase dimerization/phosphoacceptor domain-containing protein [Nonomuraea rubra]
MHDSVGHHLTAIRLQAAAGRRAPRDALAKQGWGRSPTCRSRRSQRYAACCAPSTSTPPPSGPAAPIWSAWPTGSPRGTGRSPYAAPGRGTRCRRPSIIPPTGWSRRR